MWLLCISLIQYEEEHGVIKKPVNENLEDIQVVVLGSQVDWGPLHFVLLVHNLGNQEGHLKMCNDKNHPEKMLI